jgi:hypothetical protein
MRTIVAVFAFQLLVSACTAAQGSATLAAIKDAFLTACTVANGSGGSSGHP